MPYYCWQGVRLDASYCKGTSFARDPEGLKALLLSQDIALLSCNQKKYIHIMPISADQKYLFFQNLHALIHAGVHIWQSLLLLCEQIGDPRLADITLHVADNVQSGKALHEAMASFPVFSSEMLHVTEIGAESDNLAVALQMLCAHLAYVQAFKKQVRGVLLLPACTFVIFVVIMLAVLLIIIPKYAALFASMGKEVPAMTRILMHMSDFVSSYYMIGTLFILITCITVLLQSLKKPAIKYVLDHRILKIPYIGKLIKQISLVYCLRSLSLLLKGGMPVVPALEAAKEAVSNMCIQDALSDIIEHVRSGQDLSYAMQMHAEIFSQDIILLITVGQETGCLHEMIVRAADMYTQKIQQTLQRFTFTIQPILMIVLGLLVTMLIYAVYIPLFNLADLG